MESAPPPRQKAPLPAKKKILVVLTSGRCEAQSRSILRVASYSGGPRGCPKVTKSPFLYDSVSYLLIYNVYNDSDHAECHLCVATY